jgi:hypothetical protein
MKRYAPRQRAAMTRSSPHTGTALLAGGGTLKGDFGNGREGGALGLSSPSKAVSAAALGAGGLKAMLEMGSCN